MSIISMKSNRYLLLPASLPIMLSCNGTANKTEKPNFIVILADDQGYNDLGCFGSALIRTPNLDRLAAEGIRMTDFYAQPVSGPSRTALLTGCYPIRVAEIGNLKRNNPLVHPDEILIPEVLKPAGYRSGCIGKWDINGHRQNFINDSILPTRMGFDFWFGVPSSNDNGIKDIYLNEHKIEHQFTVDTITQVYTAEAIRFVRENKDRPFFLYLAHSMPHTRLGASSRFKGRSHAGPYGDAVEELDWSVGAIRKALEDLGLDKNTYILYMSDNGPWGARGTHGGEAYPLRGEKINTWEGGVRVPCVMWGGMIPRKPQTCRKVASTLDLLPTLASLAGAQLPGNHVFDGKDVSPLFRNADGKDIDMKDTYFYYMDTHLQAVRKGDWKLVRPRPQAPEWIQVRSVSLWRHNEMDLVREYELYNLADDISERRDVSARFPDKVAELKALIESTREELGDYNLVGTGARFFDEGEHRPDALYWQEKEKSGWKPEMRIHPYYDDGGRFF